MAFFNASFWMCNQQPPPMRANTRDAMVLRLRRAAVGVPAHRQSLDPELVAGAHQQLAVVKRVETQY
jgi:hypothetical protein